MARISIKIGHLEVLADTTEENPGTVKAVLKNLPIKGTAQRWGKEIYFYVPFKIPLEKAREECEEGEIGFWVGNPAIAIFFGKTPVSTSDKPRAYSKCNFFARLLPPIDKEALDAVKEKTEIVIKKQKD